METAIKTTNDTAPISKAGELILQLLALVVTVTVIAGAIAVVEAGGFLYLLAYAGLTIAGFVALVSIWRFGFWVATYRHRKGLCDCDEEAVAA